MINGWSGTSLEGVWRRRVATIDDERGSFAELWRSSWTGPVGSAEMVQANLSRSRAGVLRGMHVHLRQSDMWLLVDGRAAAALVDLRDELTGASTEQPPRSEVLEMSPGDGLF